MKIELHVKWKKFKPITRVTTFTYFCFFCFFLLFAERTDLSYPPVISSLNPLGPAADFLAPGDRLHQIDGISTIGLTNNHVLNMIMNGEQAAVVEIEYCLPDYSKCFFDDSHTFSFIGVDIFQCF